MKESQQTGPRQQNKISVATPNVAETVEAIFGCKWSLRILELIRRGVSRPGAIQQALEGLTPRVQNYYFRRMMSLGVLEKTIFPEVPPRVEYRLTAFGLRFVPILDCIQELQRKLEEDGLEGTDDRANSSSDRPVKT